MHTSWSGFCTEHHSTLVTTSLNTLGWDQNLDPGKMIGVLPTSYLSGLKGGRRLHLPM